MQYRKFLAYNVFGGIFWVLTTTLAGFYLGKAIPNIQERIHEVIAIVIFLSLLPAIIKFASERWKRRKQAS
jgi:membrane-associated protein